MFVKEDYVDVCYTFLSRKCSIFCYVSYVGLELFICVSNKNFYIQRLKIEGNSFKIRHQNNL